MKKVSAGKTALENGMGILFLLCGAITVAFVLGISAYLIISGVPAIKEIGIGKFLFGKVWDPTNTTTSPSYGILPFILTSIYGTAGAVIIGVPIGILTAVFLARTAPPRLASVIHRAVELLAGIPSVVYGLVGMIVLVPAIRSTFGLSSGACRAASTRRTSSTRCAWARRSSSRVRWAPSSCARTRRNRSCSLPARPDSLR